MKDEDVKAFTRMVELLDVDDNSEFGRRAGEHSAAMDAFREYILHHLAEMAAADIEMGMNPIEAGEILAKTSMEIMFWVGYQMAKEGYPLTACECMKQPGPHNAHLN